VLQEKFKMTAGVWKDDGTYMFDETLEKILHNKSADQIVTAGGWTYNYNNLISPWTLNTKDGTIKAKLL
jgi:putative NADPH-quinone reductase